LFPNFNIVSSGIREVQISKDFKTSPSHLPCENHMDESSLGRSDSAAPKGERPIIFKLSK